MRYLVILIAFMFAGINGLFAHGSCNNHYNRCYNKNDRNYFVVPAGSRTVTFGVIRRRPVVRSFGYHNQGWGRRGFRGGFNQNYRRSYHPKTRYRDYGYVYQNGQRFVAPRRNVRNYRNNNFYRENYRQGRRFRRGSRNYR